MSDTTSQIGKTITFLNRYPNTRLRLVSPEVYIKIYLIEVGNIVCDLS